MNQTHATIKNKIYKQKTKNLTSRLINKLTKKNKQIKIDNKSIRIVSISLLNTNQIKQLKDIYNKSSSRTNWTIEQIKNFIIDEKKQIEKPDIQRAYYSYCIFVQNNLVGYIIGKKTSLLQRPFIGNYKPNKFDLLFSIGLDSNFRGQGIGTRAIDLFIKMYKQKIALLNNYAKKARLYSDIAPDNTASIKVFEKNDFHYSHNIRISGKPYRRYIRLVFN